MKLACIFVIFLFIRIKSAVSLTNFVYNSGNLQGFYNLAKSFVNSVSSREVPFENLKLLVAYLTSNNSRNSKEIWDLTKSSVFPFVGLMILLIVGIGYMVVMPIVGLCLCCWNACGKSYDRRQRKTESKTVYISLTTLLTITTVMIAAGVILYIASDFQSFDDLTINLERNAISQIDGVKNFVIVTMRDFKRFTSDEFGNVFNFTQVYLKKLINDIDRLLRNETNVDSFKNLNKSTQVIAEFDISFSRRFNELKTDAEELKANLTYANATEDFETLDFYLQMHSEIRLSLHILAEISLNLLAKLDDGSLAKSIQTVDNIRAKLNQNVMDKEAEFNAKFSDPVNEIAKINTLANDYIQEISDWKQTVTEANISEKLRAHGWAQWILVAAVSPIALMVLITMSALIFGYRGYEYRLKPHARGRRLIQEEKCLCASVCLAFIFSFFLMAIAVVTFFIGFTGEAILCRFAYPDPSKLLQFLEETQLIRGMPKLPPMHEVIASCEDNQSIYKSLQLWTYFDVEDMLKLAPNNFSTINLPLVNNEILMVQDDKTKSLLQQMQNNTDKTYNQMLALITNESLVLSQLNHSQFYLNFTKKATQYRSSNSEFLQHLNSTKTSINRVLTNSISLETLKANVNMTGLAVVMAINERLKQSRQFILDGFNSEIGNCRNLYDIYVNLSILLCSQLLNPIHGIWLGLGWCLFLTIPFIIISMKLSETFHRVNPASNLISPPIDAYDRVFEISLRSPPFTSGNYNTLSYPPTTAWHS